MQPQLSSDVRRSKSTSVRRRVEPFPVGELSHRIELGADFFIQLQDFRFMLDDVLEKYDSSQAVVPHQLAFEQLVGFVLT